MDKRKIAFYFSRAAKSYDKHAWYPQETAKILTGWLSRPKRMRRILDIGCGTGALALNLGKRFPDNTVIGFDLAQGMVRVANNQAPRNGEIFLQADLEKIPFKDDSFEIAVSNLVYQRISSLREAFKEVNRVLLPAGRFYLCVATDQALKELRASFVKACKKLGRKNPSAVYSHPGRDKIIRALQDSGFKIKRTKEYQNIKFYRHAKEVVLWLKSIGANYYYRSWLKGINSRAFLNEVNNIYQGRYGRNGKIFASFNSLLVEAEKL